MRPGPVNAKRATRYALESAIARAMLDFLARLSPWLEWLSQALERQLPLLVAGTLAVLLMLVLGAVLAGAVSRRRAALRMAEAHSQLELRLVEASRTAEAQLAELKGRLAAMAEIEAVRQAELTQRIDQRLDAVSERLGGSVQSVGERTSENLSRLYERLAVLEKAQTSLGELSSQVVSLKDILGNKQARGAFGQMRMEAIIEDGLPRGSYQFQATLSNGKRPDCLVRLPGVPLPLAIDAKFPVEGFEALRTAQSPAEAQAASARIREAIGRHIDDIAGKYLIAGETQDMALMFVPAESVYAELHERLPELVQKAHRSRVVIVSPNMLMLAVQTMQAILKDVRMREQAGLIQREVGLLIEDVARLAERVRDLDKHFTLAAKDVEKVLATTEKITGRGRRIETVELADSAGTGAEPGPPVRALSR